MGQITVPTSGDLPKTCDAVVIGGGIIGVATAFWLSRSGLDTVLVEMRQGLSTLTTPNSVECFRAQFTEPAMAELAKRSIQIFENFPEVIGISGYEISLHHAGYLFVTSKSEMTEPFKNAVKKHRALGIDDSEFLTSPELHARFPYLSENAVAATFRQRDGWLSSHEATQGFAKGSDAKYFLSTKAIKILRDAGGVSGLETDKGTIYTRIVINAAGPFAGAVARTAGLDLPLEPVRRQKAFIASQSLIPPDAPMTIDVDQDAYWRPEVGGAYVGWVDPDEPVSDPSEDLPTDRHFAAITIEKLIHLSPFWDTVAATLKAPDVHVSAGQYVYTPDDQPLIGAIPYLPGCFLNCGYWAGVMLSAAAGERIADLVTGKMKPAQNPLRPSRFDEGIIVKGDSFLRGRH